MFNISYEATLVAGQIGFSLHEESTPVVEPFAGWAMLTTQDTHLAVRNHIQASQLQELLDHYLLHHST